MQTVFRWLRVTILLTGLLGLCARFVALEASPPGFVFDEAAIAAHSICLRQTGHDAYGQRWPLFSRVGPGHGERCDEVAAHRPKPI